MHPYLSMNRILEPQPSNTEVMRHRLLAAQSASLPLTFFPPDGSAPLMAWAFKETGGGWWDIIVDNVCVEDGTPHRIFETSSRQVGPLDKDRKGLFVLSGPPGSGQQERTDGPVKDWREAQGQRGAKEVAVKECYEADAQGPMAEDAAEVRALKAEVGQAILGQGAMMGSLSGVAQGVAQMPNAPGRLFRRSDILAIIRAQHGIAPNFHAKEALDGVARIIESLEIP